MRHFFWNLFESNTFVPKRLGGAGWTQSLVTLDIISHLVIILAFLSIPISLYYLKAHKINGLIKPQIYSMFYWFCIICAISRTSSILVYFWPAQRFYILINYICAFAVCQLAWQLKDALQYLINIPPFDHIQNINKQQQQELNIRRIQQEELELEVKKLNQLVINLQDILQRELWIHDRQGTLVKIGDMLELLGKSNDILKTPNSDP